MCENAMRTTLGSASQAKVLMAHGEELVLLVLLAEVLAGKTGSDSS